MKKNAAWSATPRSTQGFDSVRTRGEPTVAVPTTLIPLARMTCPTPPTRLAIPTHSRVLVIRGPSRWRTRSSARSCPPSRRPSDDEHPAVGGDREPRRRRRARHPGQRDEGGRDRHRRLAPRAHAVEPLGAPRRRAPGGVLLHLHGAALARGRQQGAAAHDGQLHHRRPPRAAHAGRAGDAAALDRHRLHRARRFPGIAHLKPRGALAAAALAAALAAPFLFTGLGRAPFDDPGEGMHAEIARELAASGDPLRLTLDGVRYVDKPPLLYLLLASAFAVGGASEGTARAVAALGALVAVAATAWP